MLSEAQDQTGQREPEELDFAEVILPLPWGWLTNAWRNVHTPPSRNVTGAKKQRKKKSKECRRITVGPINSQNGSDASTLWTESAGWLLAVKTVEINGIESVPQQIRSWSARSFSFILLSLIPNSAHQHFTPSNQTQMPPFSVCVCV